MFLIGVARLGKDAVVRQVQSGDTVMELSLAFNYGRKSDEKTQWINATMWGERVSKIAQYLTKGTQVFVNASEPHIEEFTRKDGTTGTSLRVKITSLDFVGPRSDASAAPAPKQEQKGFNDIEDDIPF